MSANAEQLPARAPEQPAGKATTMTALKAAPSPDSQFPIISIGFESLQAFELTQRVAKMFSASTVVPDTFRGNIGNCAIALEMAIRMRASPLMVMQNLDVIYGRPAWRAKFLIACFNQCGRYETIWYEWGGQKHTDSWSCRAHSADLRTRREVQGPEISIKLAKDEGWYDKKGSKWKTIPELMLMYRAGAWLVNTTAPEISMGLPTDDEVRDTYNAQRGNDGRWSVDLENLRTSLPQVSATAPDPAEWSARLHACDNLQTLSTEWQKCVEAFDGTAPNECDAAFQNRRESITEREGREMEERSGGAAPQQQPAEKGKTQSNDKPTAGGKAGKLDL